MNAHCLPQPIALHRSPAARWLDWVRDFAGAGVRRLALHRAAYAALRRQEREQRALAELSLHTLCDIGAAPARTERRRGLEREEAERLSRILVGRGW